MANMAALSGDNTHAAEGELRGLFADDRQLGEWFGQQLNDDALYLEAARERAEYVASSIDLLVQRGLQLRQEELQQRQEHFNLALAGVLGAIVMVLTAIQSLQYSVPLPPLIKPAVITTLGAVALLAALVTLRVAAAKRMWTLWLVWVGVGAAFAAATWVVVSALASDAASTGWWAGGGFAAGVGVAVLVTWLLRWRAGAYTDSDRAPG
jgi:hypothetical protein